MDHTFHIFTSPDIVKDVAFVPDDGLSFTIASNSIEEELLVKIPKNFPLLTTREDASHFDGWMVAIGDEWNELESKTNEHECFVEYLISVHNSTRIDLLYALQLVEEPFIKSNPVDKTCLEKTSSSHSMTEKLPTDLILELVKRDAGKWAAGTLDDESFAQALLYLTYTNMIEVKKLEAGVDRIAVPEWMKYNAQWWANDAIDNDTFVNALQYAILTL